MLLASILSPFRFLLSLYIVPKLELSVIIFCIHIPSKFIKATAKVRKIPDIHMQGSWLL